MPQKYISPRLKPLLPRVLILLFALLPLGCGGDQQEEEEEAQQETQATPVQVVEIRRERLEETVSAVGSLEAFRRVELQPEVTGILESIAFEEGAAVSEGDLLFEIDDEQMREQIAAQQAALQAAQAQQRLTSSNLGRYRELSQRGSVSPAEFEEVQATSQQAEAQVSRLQEEIALLESRLDDTTIRAPFAGIMSEHLVDEGVFVQPGRALATLYKLDPLEVAFTLPERLMDRVQEGLPVTLEVSAYPERRFEGQIQFISPVINPRTREFLVKAQVDNGNAVLKPGAFATIHVTLEVLEGRPVAPEEALVSTREGYVLFVVEEGQAQEREVEVGLRRPGLVEIAEGVEVGERVVRTGHMNLADGDEVRIAEEAPAEETETNEADPAMDDS